MSAKRRATTELNHNNWDQEDETENQNEESEEFKIASKDILEKRVMRVAKRRSKNLDTDVKKSAFSGFTGFNKEQKPSFDFLANLTNNSNSSSPSIFAKSDAKPPTTSTTSPFMLPGMGSNSPYANLAKTSESTVFGTLFNSSPGQSLFTSSKTDLTTKDSLTKMQVMPTPSADINLKPSLNSSMISATNQTSIFGAKLESSAKSQMVPTTNADFTSKPTLNSPFVSPSKQTSIFGGNIGNSKLNTVSTNNTPFKIQNSNNSHESSETLKSENISNKENDIKLDYYSKLKGLNESVSDWIKKHVEKTPLCILTPIFKDYEKYLKEIQDEYEKEKEEFKNTNKRKEDLKNTDKSPKLNLESSTKLPTTVGSSVSTMFSDTGSFKSIFSQNTQEKNTNSNFSFGTNVISTAPSTTTATQSTGFSFGITSTPVGSSLTSPISGTNGTGAPFSFGIGQPFSFNSNVKQSEEPANEDGEDEPPKMEYNPVVEENSVFDKKCKIFVKKDKNFIDKGVGTLYIKKIEGNNKYQLIVRANTNLGNILLNLILSSSIPIQRMGQNNVMMVCIPTPETKPPPVPILVRVKTADEADELLKTLDKYKT